MGLSVCMSRLYCSAWKTIISKGNKGNRPERQLAALAKQALRTSVYIRVLIIREGREIRHKDSKIVYI
jgi:hypothetical protein